MDGILPASLNPRSSHMTSLRFPKTLLRAATLAIAVLCAGPLAGQRKGLKNGLWQKRHCPPGWLLHHSKNYQIQSQVGKDKAKRLAEHMEAMLKIYKKLFRPGKPSSKRYAVKLFKDRRGFIAYGRIPGAAAYYSPTAKEMVLYDTGKWSDEREAPTTGINEDGGLDYEALKKKMNMDILGVASHEGWHQYFHWYVTSWVYLPSWVNEGMGDYFYTVTPKKVKGRKIKPQLGVLNEVRLPTIQAAVRAKRHVPVKKLLQYTKRDYYSNPGICYAEGWALCHFLLHSPKKEYNQIVPRFIRRFKDRGNWQRNTELVFKKIDLDQLEKDFTTWVLAQKYKSPVQEALERIRSQRRPVKGNAPRGRAGQTKPNKVGG